MDLNIMASPSDLSQQESWKHLVCKMSDETKTCRPFLLNECRREQIRLAVSPDSVCGDSGSARTVDCGCVDRDCQDNAAFVDELGYFCHQWIGDDCGFSNAAKWGMSASGQESLAANCPRSCGKCPWLTPCPYTGTKNCSEHPSGPPQCSACLGKVSGVDIEGNCMQCPTGANKYGSACAGSGGSAGGGEDCQDDPNYRDPEFKDNCAGWYVWNKCDGYAFTQELKAKCPRACNLCGNNSTAGPGQASNALRGMSAVCDILFLVSGWQYFVSMLQHRW